MKSQRIRNLLLCVGLLATSWAHAQSEEALCAAQMGLPTVQVSAGEVVTPNTVGQLPALALTKEATGAALVGNRLTMGLASAVWTYDFSLNGRALKTASGRTCVAVANLRVTVRLEDLQVRLASELRPGSCAYNEVLEHELEHVSIYRTSLPLAAEAMQASLNTAGVIRVAVGQSEDEAYAKLKQEVLDVLDGQLHKHKNLTAQKHAAHDSPAEYGRVADSCQGEMRRVLETAAGNAGASTFAPRWKRTSMPER